MRLRGLRQGLLSLFVLVSFLSVCLRASARHCQNLAPKINAKAEELSANQQHALALLEGLADELKSETDKPAAAVLQARAGDILWKFNESAARNIFRTAFDLARQTLPENLSGSEKLDYLHRQAAAIREVLRLFGVHDRKTAETWLKKVHEERTTENRLAAERSTENAELLAQLALGLLPDNPEQALQLGLLSLSGREIPESFGRLLFRLSNQNRGASDALFREAIINLRRNGYSYSNALIALSNYLFDSRGVLRSDAARPDAQLLINLFIDAAAAHVTLWREAHHSGEAGVPESSANLYSFLASRALPIIGRYAADSLPALQAEMNELSSGLTQQQSRETAILISAQQQQVALSDRNNYDIHEQVERAEGEKDPQLRDVLLRSAALNLMRGNAGQALAVAGEISDDDLRAQTEDDINLKLLQELLRSRAYDEGRTLALKLNSVNLKARALVELAGHALSEIKDIGRASDFLSEARLIVQRGEDTPDKLFALLLIAEQFAKFDSVRGFETLSLAIKTANHLKAENLRPPVSPKALPITFKIYTVLNGKEVTTSERASVDSIDFVQVSNLALQDYIQAIALGNRIENRLVRAKFLMAVARSALISPRPSSPLIGTPAPPVIRKTGKQSSPSL